MGSNQVMARKKQETKENKREELYVLNLSNEKKSNECEMKENY
jgi:hypothetical protein